MKPIRVKAIARKELIQIWRDPLSLAMAFLMPVMLLFIFGYAITLDVRDLKTIVYDQDRSAMSREFVSGLTASGYFDLVAEISDHRDIDAYLDKGRALVAVTIPSDFSKKIRTARQAEIQVIVDGSDSNTASIAVGYLTAMSEVYSSRAGNAKAPPVIETRVRVWYNPELKSRNFIIPGLIAVIMAVIAALLTSLTIAREWERGTMEQLISTPVTKRELITGKLIPYFFIGMIDVMLSVLVATQLFGVPLRGSVFLLFSLSGIFLFGGLSLGILISIVARSQLVASQISLIATFLPAFLLSGFMYSISNMPKPLQGLTHVIPARYFVSMLKGIFLKGSSAGLLLAEIFLLSAFGLIVFSLANRKFRKQVE